MYRNYSAEEILEAITKYYTESVFITDGDGIVVFVNDIGAERLNAKREQLIGRNVDELVGEGVYEQSTTRRAIETGKACIATLDPGKKSSTVSHSTPVLDDSGRVVMVVTANMSLEHNKEWESILSEERELTARLRREIDNLRLNETTKVVIKFSDSIKRIYHNIDIVAPTDSNIVIVGESGTGKDMTARYIHENSKRSGKAFISINCAAIPEALLESELFGYEAGAFTGALSKGKIGLFEAADGGTLFLDEIGEMPMGLQSKLLNAIEDKSIRKVGGVKHIPVDVRIVCATNANLDSLIKAKKFREDLYYRLSVFTIQLPPLRERKADILPLAEHFLSEMNRKNGTRKFLSDATKESMLLHIWPGNIRELRNVVERIFVISASDSLDFLPTPTFSIPTEMYDACKAVNSSAYDSLKAYIDEVEIAYIEKCLKEVGGSMTQAAKRLKIDRSALYRKMKRLKG